MKEIKSEVLIIYSSTRKIFLCFLLFIAFLLMAFNAETENYFDELTLPLAPYFFGFFAIISLLMILPKSSWLKIGPDGFEVCAFFIKRFIPWKDTSDFYVDHYRFSKTVVYTFSDEKKTSIKWSVNHKEFIGGMYEKSADEIVEILKSYRKAALKERQESSENLRA